ncbi:MAG: hypothetical protein ACE5II_02615, partial [Anaerolineae bacterium]
GSMKAAYDIPIEAPLGTWTVSIDVTDAYGNGGSGMATFAVKPAILDVDVILSAQAYEISETLTVSVSVSYPDGSPVATPSGSLDLSPIGASVQLTRVGPGLLQGSYSIPSGAPKGAWSASVEAADPHGNGGGAQASFIVKLARFSVQVVAQPSQVERLTEVTFTAQVRYPSGGPVVEASTSLEWPGGRADMSEQAGGVYVATFTPRADFPLGGSDFVVKVEHQDGLGEEVISLSVSAAGLAVTPGLDREVIRAGEAVVVSAVITYPDGNEITSGTVRAIIRGEGGETLTTLAMSYDSSEGAFVTQWSTELDVPTGIFTVEISAQDAYGNAGNADLSLIVEPAPILAQYVNSPLAVGLTILTVLIIAGLITYGIRRRGSRGGGS